MYKNVLQAISGIEIYPVLSLLIFFLLFSAVVAWALTRKSQHLQYLAQLPLETDHQEPPFPRGGNQ
jgi:cbb3-type cytochrome oxidase subunit 3